MHVTCGLWHVRARALIPQGKIDCFHLIKGKAKGLINKGAPRYGSITRGARRLSKQFFLRARGKTLSKLNALPSCSPCPLLFDERLKHVHRFNKNYGFVSVFGRLGLCGLVGKR